MGTYQAKGEGSDFASVVLEERTFMGGTETKTLSADTYNMKNGNDAVLTDIVTDSKKELETLMEKGFSALIDQNPDAFYSDAKDRLDKNLDEVGFYLDKNAVVFYLNSGIIAPGKRWCHRFFCSPITDLQKKDAVRGILHKKTKKPKSLS